MTSSDLIGYAVIGFIIYTVFFGSSGLFWSKAEIMARQRRRNAKRGITMMRNFSYLDPDGSRHMSRTGRERDCSCGGKHESHRGYVNADNV